MGKKYILKQKAVKQSSNIPKQYLVVYKQSNCIPSMVRDIDSYYISKGYLGMGKIAGSNADTIIGRYWDDQLHTVLPLPQATQTITADPHKYFQMKSGQVANLWNTFSIKAAQLKNFLDETQTDQKTSNWQLKQLQSFTSTSQLYSWVSTLFYVYVFPSIPVSGQIDINQYFSATKYNFAYLSIQQQKQLIMMFIQLRNKSLAEYIGSLQTFFDQIIKGRPFQSKVERIQNFKQIPIKYSQNVRTYLSKQGVSQKQIIQLLDGGIKQPSNVKTTRVSQAVRAFLSPNQTKSTVKYAGVCFDFPLNRKDKSKFPPISLSNRNYIYQIKNMLSDQMYQGIKIQ